MSTAITGIRNPLVDSATEVKGNTLLGQYSRRHGHREPNIRSIPRDPVFSIRGITVSSIFASGEPLNTAHLSSETQPGVWFLGALVTIRAGGEHSAGSVAVLDRTGPRGYSPRHVHTMDE